MNVLNSVDVILGVDTHRDTHTAAFVERTGAVLQMLTFPATPAGYATARKAAAKWPGTNALHALVVTAPADTRELLRALTSIALVRKCASFRAMRSLAKRVLGLETEAVAL